eukprot:1168966-Amphidinium_carterae.1
MGCYLLEKSKGFDGSSGKGSSTILSGKLSRLIKMTHEELVADFGGTSYHETLKRDGVDVCDGVGGIAA